MRDRASLSRRAASFCQGDLRGRHSPSSATALPRPTLDSRSRTRVRLLKIMYLLSFMSREIFRYTIWKNERVQAGKAASLLAKQLNIIGFRLIVDLINHMRALGEQASGVRLERDRYLAAKQDTMNDSYRIRSSRFSPCFRCWDPRIWEGSPTPVCRGLPCAPRSSRGRATRLLSGRNFVPPCNSGPRTRTRISPF